MVKKASWKCFPDYCVSVVASILQKPTFVYFLFYCLFMDCINVWSARMEIWPIHTVTLDLVLSIRAVTMLFSWKSLAGASVKTNMSEDGGADVSASFQSHKGEESLLFIWSIRLKTKNVIIVYGVILWLLYMIIALLLLYRTLLSKWMIPRQLLKY